MTGGVGVFVVGDDLSIHHKWTAADGQGWSSWEDLGGVTERGIAACSWSPGRTDLFHRGQDRVVYHKWFDALVVGTDDQLYISELS